MSEAQTAIENLSSVPLGTIVGRIFPHARQPGLSLEEMIPGRYWPAWKMPPDPTDLDRAVAQLAQDGGRRRFLTRETLAASGIACPFYAWRIHAIYAANQANRTFRGFSAKNRERLQFELDSYKRRVALSKIIILSSVDDGAFSGSIHLEEDDFDIELYENIQPSRFARIAEIEKEIIRDESIIRELGRSIARIDRVMEGREGNQAPDRWRTPFFIYMASLWVASTGKEVPDNGKFLTDILTSITDVISDGASVIEGWGQARVLNRRFKGSPAGHGFRLGESGFLSTEGDTELSSRGAELEDLVCIARGTREASIFERTIAECTIYLRDHNEGDLFIVLRDCVLIRHFNEDLNSRKRIILQIGWVINPGYRDIAKSIKNIAYRASIGDLASICVLEVARSYSEDIAKVVGAPSYSQPFAGLSPAAFYNELESQTARDPQSSDGKAFAAAMWIVERLGER